MQIKNINRDRVGNYLDNYPQAIDTPVDPALSDNPLCNYPADCAFPLTMNPAAA